ncbi:MAG: DUF1810 domain-containing protein [Chitinophagales bacterium]
MNPNYNLDRFIEAQETEYERAYHEIQQGKKINHWMWYIFPQIAGLGKSSTSRYFAIADATEAELYLAHPVLGKRLAAICQTLLNLENRSAYSIFGSPDDSKFLSCITLFESIESPYSELFKKLIDKYYNGRRDKATLKLLME